MFKSSLKSRNGLHHSVQNLLSFRLLSTKINIKIYKTLILPLVVDGCEKPSLSRRGRNRGVQKNI
jgi:hypothetical protein